MVLTIFESCDGGGWCSSVNSYDELAIIAGVYGCKFDGRVENGGGGSQLVASHQHFNARSYYEDLKAKEVIV